VAHFGFSGCVRDPTYFPDLDVQIEIEIKSKNAKMGILFLSGKESGRKL